jgi:hypothetical protein
MKASSLMKVAPMLLGVAAMVGCTHITALSKGGPVGAYSAIILVMTQNSTPTNVLANGGSFTINLAPDGKTSGRLHIIGSADYPVIDADLAGTWTQNGDTVDFTQASDTFVNRMTFRIEPLTEHIWWLVGDDVFGTTRVNVRLAQNTR